jgi:hypothetical protein
LCHGGSFVLRACFTRKPPETPDRFRTAKTLDAEDRVKPGVFDLTLAYNGPVELRLRDPPATLFRRGKVIRSAMAGGERNGQL